MGRNRVRWLAWGILGLSVPLGIISLALVVLAPTSSAAGPDNRPVGLADWLQVLIGIPMVLGFIGVGALLALKQPLREGGLVAALRPHAVVSPHGVGRYDPEIEAGLYFSCLEAVQNATKYARASSVRVDLRQQNGTLMFTVVDDGVGFDPAAASMGSGVRSMKDRIASLGGRLILDSKPGKGTTVSGSLPLRTLGVAR
jgi:signal transduction histidine kinase